MMDAIGIMRIMALIPHRYPMLLVDRIAAMDETSITGVKAVTINEPFFQGHFPGRPIMPGVLIVEALAQTAAVHAITALGAAAEGKLVYFMSIDHAKFRKPVEPGVLLHLHATLQRHRGPVRTFHGEARVGDVVMAEASFTAMIADRPDAV